MISMTNGASSRPDELETEPMDWSRGDEIKESIHMMVSHHPPSLYGHCLRVSFRGKSLYLCGRCTGIYGGLGLGILTIFLLQIPLEPSWAWFIVAVAIGLATVIDWTSQRLTPRKTTNRARFWTGLVSGFGLAIIFMLRNLFFMLIALIGMTVSVGVVSLIENQRRQRAIEAARKESGDQ
ncbi:DUF2085 domain-containing protein [Candidatus Thorarchaeota archaeon]|nr:MAG: DUF2085 domain-containing protein [Candidatus Thorarchaeota archaeon]